MQYLCTGVTRLGILQPQQGASPSNFQIVDLLNNKGDESQTGCINTVSTSLPNERLS